MSLNWDKYFLDMAVFVAQKSKDISTKVGSVIVGPDKEVRSTGFNGFPRRVNDEKPERLERPLKYLWTEHSERNAIFAAAKIGIPLDNCSIYVDFYPCADCARAIIQAGIREVIVDGRDYQNKFNLASRWKESLEIAKTMLSEAGVKIRLYLEEKNNG
jgi:dCMP deaminase